LGRVTASIGDGGEGVTLIALRAEHPDAEKVQRC